MGSIQLASSVPGRFAFYGVFLGNFDHLKIPLKVPKTSFSFLTLINIDQIFLENDFWSCRTRGYKNVGPQSLRPPGFERGSLGEQRFTT